MTTHASSPAEPFMNPAQVAHFRAKLERLRDDTQRELGAAPPAYAEANDREGDQTDQASAAEDRAFTQINRERAHALLVQIEQALVRLDNGTYGYCEDTGHPIDLRRLEAEPTATLSTAAKAAREKK
jgi:DnaK suppressor protein